MLCPSGLNGGQFVAVVNFNKKGKGIRSGKAQDESVGLRKLRVPDKYAAIPKLVLSWGTKRIILWRAGKKKRK